VILIFFPVVVPAVGDIIFPQRAVSGLWVFWGGKRDVEIYKKNDAQSYE
jgi:hypothetical protein